jgi:hypothetical protein
VKFLLGDSTESDLEFNYLTFLREVVDSAVVLLEAEGTLGENVEKRTTRASESAGMIRAVEELGKDAAALVDPVAKEQPKTPAGKCAAAIGKAIKDAVDAETKQAKTSLETMRAEIDREDEQVRTRARGVLEKLLRAHDLPNVDKELEAQWATGAVKAKMRQRAQIGVEAVLALEAQGSTVLAADLRVDRIGEGIEVHSREAGGWLKKSDKLVAQKLGRFQIVGVTVAAKQVTIQLRSPDTSASTLAVSVPRSGEIVVDGGGGGKEYVVEERDRAGLKLLADKLEAALHELEDQRTGLVELAIDGKTFAEHGHPRVLAERLIQAVAPVVQKIARHSRSPGELVLRRQIEDGRREEVFISISELTKRIDTLPATSRAAFAPLQLGGEPAKAELRHEPRHDAKPEPKHEVKPEAKHEAKPEPKPEPVKPEPSKPEPVVELKKPTIPPPARTSPRTVPPPPPRPPADAHGSPTPALDAAREADAKLAVALDAALADDAPKSS